MINAVIFDMDGVIVDNRDIHVEAFRLLAQRHGVSFCGEGLEWMYGRGNDTIIPRLFPPEVVGRAGLAELGREKETIYREIYRECMVPARGLVALLDELRDNGLPCAVGSSAPRRNVDFVLERCGIADYFSVVVTGDMVEFRKPDPSIFRMAAERLGVTPAECLVFEDSTAGIQAARSAGMPVIALATTLTAEQLSEVHDGLTIPDFTYIDYHGIKNFRTCEREKQLII